MSAVAVVVGILAAGGAFLVLQRGVVRVALGFVLLGHAANVLLLASGGLRNRGVPIVGASQDPGDPLPQAFVLTAIVIGFGMTAFLLALAFRAGELFGVDDTEGESRDEDEDDGGPSEGGSERGAAADADAEGSAVEDA
ncbi:MAG TPA: NADH-quinone oxidoreductase subunit K [Actinomycetota bacterium]|nr:NADH-quinone oxidoreductase subunit K [Actinomycetota bacterium]